MESIKDILIRRDEMSPLEADTLIKEAREEMQRRLREDDQEGAYNICEEYFGLEPDWLMELLG